METVFWQRFQLLCREFGLSPNGVMVATGMNSGNPPQWRNGRIPGANTLQVLSAYFDCPIDYLLGKSDERYRPGDPRRKEPEEKEKATGAEPGAISEEELKFALFGTTEVTDELYQSVINFAKVAQEMEARKKGG